MSGIRLIVGLGNPGERYAGTRHNIGLLFVEELLKRHGGRLQDNRRFRAQLAVSTVDEARVQVAIPLTFMNQSGDAVGPLARYFRIVPDQVLVVCDEVAFEPGVARLKAGGGANGHNGIRSVISGFSGSNEFLRLRLGVGHPGDPDEMTSYLTAHTPPAGERDAYRASVDASLDVLPMVVAGDLEKAMTQLHTAPAQ